MKFKVFAGSCVIESENFVMELAAELKKIFSNFPQFDFHFKASFDKANRSSINSFRGPGISKGLEILSKVKAAHNIKIITDFHSSEQALAVSEVADFIQIPAFLCRQTDLIVAGAKAALKNNCGLKIKKGQFLAPTDCKNIISKVRSVEESTGNKFNPQDFLITERGSSFGYNNLLVDMSSFREIQALGVQCCYDATHSVQKPGAGSDGSTTGGARENIDILTRAALAAGADALFFECHPNPKEAKSDGPNALPLEWVPQYLENTLKILQLRKELKPIAN